MDCRNTGREEMDINFDVREEIERLGLKRRTLKEVATRLGFNSAAEVKYIAEILGELVREGKLAEVDGRYSAPQRIGAYFGTLRGNKKGFAFLIREDGGEDIFIPHSRLNGAMHGDKVYATIIKGDEGKVICIAERGIKELVGTYVREKGYGFVIPDGTSYYSDLFVAPVRGKKIPDNSKVLAEIVSYEGRNPTAVIKEVIGRSGERQSEVLSILKSYGFYNTFPDDVYNEIRSLNKNKAGSRTDLRELLTVTIDGDDSKDLDDAISLVKKGDMYELYVHIADVSHYVRMGGALDREALKRATSVYFPSSVYPMLPKEISNGICSLNEGEERLTLTVRCLLDNDGNLVDSEIMKSIIVNDARLTYNIVNRILNIGDEELEKKYSSVVPMLKDMRELANILTKKREKRGYINFDTKESKIILDANGDVVDIMPYPYLERNGIIEEFMLLANETVAEYMSNMEYPFIYRIHEKPDSDKMREFMKFAEGCGLTLNVREIHSSVLQKLLKQVEGQPIEPIISKVMLRCMKKARYSVDNVGHFGLAAMYYCHFTSPIRRYPDLMIHRIIKWMLDGKLDEKAVERLEPKLAEIADISSERERSAENAERDIDDYYKALYMSDRIGEKGEGTVSGVTDFAIFVELPNTVEGAIRLENLPTDDYTFDEGNYTVVGKKHRYALGQRVNIIVSSVDTEKRRVNFVIDEESEEI